MMEDSFRDQIKLALIVVDRLWKRLAALMDACRLSEWLSIANADSCNLEPSMTELNIMSRQDLDHRNAAEATRPETGFLYSNLPETAKDDVCGSTPDLRASIR